MLISLSLSMPLQITYQLDLPWYLFFSHLDKMTYLNWPVFAMGLINGYLIIQVFGFLKYSLPIYLLLLITNNFLVYDLHPFNTSYLPHFVSVAVLGIFAFALLRCKLWQYLSRPNMRWWATAPRVSRSLPVIVHSKETKNMRAKTYDLSSTGAFLSQLDDSWNVKINDEIKILIDALGFECRAKIVRVTFGKGNYPEGVGIRFEHMNARTKGLIEYFITGRPENLLHSKDEDQSLKSGF